MIAASSRAQPFPEGECPSPSNFQGDGGIPHSPDNNDNNVLQPHPRNRKQSTLSIRRLINMKRGSYTRAVEYSSTIPSCSCLKPHQSVTFVVY